MLLHFSSSFSFHRITTTDGRVVAFFRLIYISLHLHWVHIQITITKWMKKKTEEREKCHYECLYIAIAGRSVRKKDWVRSFFFGFSFFLVILSYCGLRHFKGKTIASPERICAMVIALIYDRAFNLWYTSQCVLCDWWNFHSFFSCCCLLRLRAFFKTDFSSDFAPIKHWWTTE